MQPYVSANGARIPALGFGTFRLPGPDTLRMVPAALKLGFRHIDTAQIYGNEAEVGAGIAASGVNRADIFLTTKVWVDRFGHDALIASVDESLKKLRTDYVDLLLLHWPAGHALPEPVGALNEVVKAGKVRHIGVSNFNVAQMQEAIGLSAVPLVTNQVEYHPYLDQGPVSRVAHAVVRWVLQQDGLVALSKTASETRAAENFAVFDFELTAEEMAAIHALAKPDGRLVSPPALAPVWDAA